MLPVMGTYLTSILENPQTKKTSLQRLNNSDLCFRCRSWQGQKEFDGLTTPPSSHYGLKVFITLEVGLWSHLKPFLKPFWRISNSLSVGFSSVQFSCSVVSDSLRPHELQHTRPPCPSPTPGVHSDSHSSSG